MFSSPFFAPIITRCRTNAHAAPIPTPISTIGRIKAVTGPGAINTPTPARPAPIAEGPIMINRGGHSSESDATASAAVVHANDVAKEMGVEAVPVETTWATCVLDLQSIKTDL